MEKWTKKVLRYTKTIITLVKGLRVVAKCCLNWISFHDDLCCCVEYSNLENQVGIFNTYHCNLLAHHLQCLLKYVDFFLEFFCHHNLIGFLDQYVFKTLMIFFFTKFKVSVQF
jgi:hypothetical protein